MFRWLAASYIIFLMLSLLSLVLAGLEMSNITLASLSIGQSTFPPTTLIALSVIFLMPEPLILMVCAIVLRWRGEL